jgi:hypothetical protein
MRGWGILLFVAAGCVQSGPASNGPDLGVGDLAMAPSCTPAECKNTPWPVCDAQSGNCVVCLVDDHCASGKLCVNRECVAGCSPQHGCPDGGGACTAGQCNPCLNDGSCGGSTPRCDPQSGFCVPCLPTNDNCPSGHFCEFIAGAYMCSPSN